VYIYGFFCLWLANGKKICFDEKGPSVIFLTRIYLKDTGSGGRISLLLAIVFGPYFCIPELGVFSYFDWLFQARDCGWLCWLGILGWILQMLSVVFVYA
jgi:hypothetical protein